MSTSKTAPAEKEQATTDNLQEVEENDNVWCYNRTQTEWLMFIHSLPGGIVLVVMATMNWNECQVIPSLQYMVLFFGIDVIFRTFIQFFKRTERLKEEGVFNGWVAIDVVLTLCLLGFAIWGATLTYGNTDMAGDGPGQCNNRIFYAALIASAICFAIFVLVFLYIAICWRRLSQEYEAKQQQASEDDKQESPAECDAV